MRNVLPGVMLTYFRTLAHANRLANHRLHAACAKLTDANFQATRTGFFPSLHATLNHILTVDWYYLAALHGETNQRKAFAVRHPFEDLRSLAAAQLVADKRLLAWCAAASETTLETRVALERANGVEDEHLGYMLLHLFTHQIHHRGQAHAMLSGTSIKPPQLDDFIMQSDAPFRADDLQAVAWTEADLYR